MTGASDRGIGGEIAVRLASEGAAVAIVSRREPARLLKKLNRLKQGAVHTAGDVTKPEDIARAIDDCLGEFGKLDVVAVLRGGVVRGVTRQRGVRHVGHVQPLTWR